MWIKSIGVALLLLAMALGASLYEMGALSPRAQVDPSPEQRDWRAERANSLAQVRARGLGRDGASATLVSAGAASSLPAFLSHARLIAERLPGGVSASLDTGELEAFGRGLAAARGEQGGLDAREDARALLGGAAAVAPAKAFAQATLSLEQGGAVIPQECLWLSAAPDEAGDLDRWVWALGREQCAKLRSPEQALTAAGAQRALSWRPGAWAPWMALMREHGMSEGDIGALAQNRVALDARDSWETVERLMGRCSARTLGECSEFVAARDADLLLCADQTGIAVPTSRFSGIQDAAGWRGVLAELASERAGLEQRWGQAWSGCSRLAREQMQALAEREPRLAAR